MTTASCPCNIVRYIRSFQVWSELALEGLGVGVGGFPHTPYFQSNNSQIKCPIGGGIFTI